MSSPSFQDFFDRLVQVTDIENQSQLAQVLGVGRAAISLAKQKESVPWKWIFALAEAYELNSHWLATGSGQPQAQAENPEHKWMLIPHAHYQSEKGHLVQKTSAPRIAFPVSTEMQPDTPHPYVSIEMIGPSMEPTIKDMDLLLLDQNQDRLIPGLVYALDLGGHLHIRRVDIHHQSLTLISDNPNFPAWSCADKDTAHLRVLGEIIWLSRQMRRLAAPPVPLFTNPDHDL